MQKILVFHAPRHRQEELSIGSAESRANKWLEENKNWKVVNLQAIRASSEQTSLKTDLYLVVEEV